MQQAKKLEAEKAERYREFTLGKYAYGKGQYQFSTQLFTAALDREGPFSPMGGEIQLWLALAYQVQTPPSLPKLSTGSQCLPLYFEWCVCPKPCLPSRRKEQPYIGAQKSLGHFALVRYLCANQSANILWHPLVCAREHWIG